MIAELCSICLYGFLKVVVPREYVKSRRLSPFSPPLFSGDTVLVSLPLEFGVRRLSDVGSVVKLQYCFFGWHVDAYVRVCITVFWTLSILLGDVGLVV